MRSARFATLATLVGLALPMALLAWPLIASQDSGAQDATARQEKDETDEEPIAPEFAPLVSELPKGGAKEAVKTTAFFEVTDQPQCWPCLVARPGGGSWLVGVVWDPGAGDRIEVRTLEGDGTPTKDAVGKPTSAIAIVEGVREVLRPAAAVDGAGRLVVAWTEATDAGTLVCAARLEDAKSGEGKFGPVVKLTAAAQCARNPELALHEGQVWCCFESWTPPAAGEDPPPKAGHDKGQFDVLLAPLQDDHLGPSIRVGDGRFSDADPMVASSGGKLWVAWSQYQGRDYEIVLRGYDPKSATLDAALNVSAEAQSDDLHPSLAAGKGDEKSAADLWLAWDRVVDPGRGTSVPNTYVNRYEKAQCGVFVMTACVRSGRVLLPEGRRKLPPGVVVGAPQFSWTGGLPRIVVAADGAPWLAYRYLAHGSLNDGYGYAVVAHHWNGAGWSAPVTFDREAGIAEEPALLAVADGALVAWQRDRRFDSAKETLPLGLHSKVKLAADQAHLETKGWFGVSSLAVAAVGRASAVGGAAADEKVGAKLVERVARPAPAHFHPAADPLDDPYVSGARHFEVARGDKKWKVFWGDLHRHSCVSRCSRGMEERPLQRWEFGRDVHLYDFMALTDHSGQIDPFSWWLEDKLVRQQRTPDFCTLAGYEWSTDPYGHQNVILAGRLEPVIAPYCDLKKLYARLASADAIAIPHGTADQGRAADLQHWDDGRVTLVEVYQALRGNSEFEGCFQQSKRARVDDCYVQDALAAGHKFGLIASTDHGNGCSYAVALAERLDVPSLFEAFRARRTYGATTKGMLVDFRIDDHVMGEECECTTPPKLHVKLRGAAEFAEVVVFRDRGIFRSLGRASASSRQAVDAVITMDLTRTPKPAKTIEAEGGADDWELALRAPGCALKRDGGVVGLHRNNPNPPYARWRVDDEEATFVWPSTFDTDAVDHYYRVDLHGPADAKLTLEWPDSSRGDATRTLTVAELIAKPITGETARGPFELRASEPPDAAIDLGKGLGVRELEQEWIDDGAAPGPHWYYVRAIQVDGEVVWSSPIFVTRK